MNWLQSRAVKTDQKKTPRQAEALKERTYKRGSKVRQGIRSVQPGPVEYPNLLRLKIHAARQHLRELALLGT